MYKFTDADFRQKPSFEDIKTKILEGILKAIVVLCLMTLIGILIFTIGAAIKIIQNDCNQISEGTIVNKYCTTAKSCSTSYVFVIEGEKNEKDVQYYCDVSPIEYNEYHIGDYYKK